MERDPKLRVGFIGLGNIGKWMALSISRAGFPLTVFDIRQEPMLELGAAGARVAVSSREVAANCDVLIIMVLNHTQAEHVLLGGEGALQGLRPGATVIVMSTISPDHVLHLSDLAVSVGARYLDSPVSGGYRRAAEGSLTLMVGGPKDVMEACLPVLKAMGTNIYHAGSKVGAGQVLKTINNMLLGIQEVAASEAMVFGMKAGVDPQLLYEVVTHSTGDSWAFRHRMDRVIARDFSSKGALEILVKDLGIALSTAQELGMPLLLAPVAYKVYQMAMVAGLALEDDSAVVKAVEKMADIQVQVGKVTQISSIP